MTEPELTETASPAAPTGVATPATVASDEVPAEIKGWNWGAFFLTWIWGLAHHVWISLLALLFAFIPFLNTFGILAMMVVLGLKGNEWAWKNRQFEGVEQFKKVQRIWAIWGVVLFAIGVIISIALGGLIFGELTKQLKR